MRPKTGVRSVEQVHDVVTSADGGSYFGSRGET
jgi:hypothetical protein